MNVLLQIQISVSVRILPEFYMLEFSLSQASKQDVTSKDPSRLIFDNLYYAHNVRQQQRKPAQTLDSLFNVSQVLEFQSLVQKEQYFGVQLCQNASVGKFDKQYVEVQARLDGAAFLLFNVCISATNILLHAKALVST